MNPAELARLGEHYRRLPDAKLAELHAEGPAAFVALEVWTLLDEEFKRRTISVDPVQPTQDLTEHGTATQRTPPTAEQTEAREERRTYISLLVVGIIAFLLFGPIQCAILQQDEMMGMAVAFGPVLLFAIPFLVALVCAVVFSFTGFVDGRISLRIRLLLWYGSVAVFVLQMVALDRLTGGDRLPPKTILLFAILGYAPLLAICLMPVWWLRSPGRREVSLKG